MLPFELTKDTPYLALSGELWSVFYEYFNRNRSCYKGFLLYLLINGVFFPDFGVVSPMTSSMTENESRMVICSPTFSPASAGTTNTSHDSNVNNSTGAIML